MIEYKEIEYFKWINLEDKSGYYKVYYYTIIDYYAIGYFYNDKFHNPYGPSYHTKDNKKYYRLNGIYYGSKDIIPSDEYWQRYIKLLAFE